MQPWYKNVTLRKEAREGRSFSPDEFAIALEQVVAVYAERVHVEEVAFETDVFLVTKARAEALNATPGDPPHTQPAPGPEQQPVPDSEPVTDILSASSALQSDQQTRLRLAGTVPPEVWNRLGTKILPKLRSGDDLRVGIELSVSVDSQFARNMEMELKQILDDLELGDGVRIERL